MKTHPFILTLCIAGLLFCSTAYSATIDSLKPLPVKKDVSTLKTETEERPADLDSVVRAFDALRDSVEHAEEEKRIAYALQTSHPKPQSPRLLFPILTLFAILISLMVRLYFYQKKKE